MDFLEELKIATSTQNYRKDTVQLDAFSFPFVAQLKKENDHFVLIPKIKATHLIYTDEKEQHGQMPISDFMGDWSGVLMEVKADEESPEPDYRQHRIEALLQQAKLTGIACRADTGFLWFTIPYAQLTWGMGVLLLLKLMGLGVSILLLVHSVDANNPMVQNLCGPGRKNNCNAILKSNATKVTSWLSWSDVGFFYFSGTLLSILLVPSSLPIILWLNLLALPYTVYSITYQYREQSWCILCCTVQVLLALEAVTGLLGFSYPIYITLNAGIGMVLCLLLPVVTWAFLKPFFNEAMQLRPTQQQLKQFKNNSDLFNQALASQPRYPVGDELMPVVLGSKNPTTVITMVSNPFCGPCAYAHKTLDAWLLEYDDLQLKIVFITTDDDNDHQTKVAQHVRALSLAGDNDTVERALNDWYAQCGEKSYDNWAKKYPAELGDRLAEATKRQREWCAMAEVSYTPTILVNGYKLPQPYTLDDIKYLIA